MGSQMPEQQTRTGPSATLPSWTYHSPAFLAAERDAIFMKSWQPVGHLSDIPSTGDFMRFSLLGEEALVVRGDDGAVRAFHNVCRHRASRLVKHDQGHCGRLLQCPYHGWSYDLTGRLVFVPGEAGFDGLDKSTVRLVALEVEVYHGLVFVRFGGDGPSVSEVFGAHETTFCHYRIEEMQPLGRESQTELAVNWKVAVDNNNEAYHVPPAHPGLHRLFGNNYRLEVNEHGTSHGGSALTPGMDSPNWSERMYRRLLPEAEHLSADLQRSWHYISTFPSIAIDLYPDQVDFFQVLPLGVDRCQFRSRSYALPDERRTMRAARYLNDRINRLVGREDIDLVLGVQAGLASDSYQRGLLSREEARLQQFHDEIRQRLPDACLDSEPI